MGGETDLAIPEGIPPWRAVLFDGHSRSFAKVVEAMFERAIKPSCVWLMIRALQASDKD